MIGNLNSIFKQKIKLGGAVAYDTDAQAYFTANTAITSSADKNAINDFYVGLKSDAIYSKIKSMFLWKWNGATFDKWNLVNPQDLDSAFRCVFSTGFTHSNSGITGNGTSAYIDSFFNASLVSGISQNSFSFGFYSRTLRTALSRFAFGGNDTRTNALLMRTNTNLAQYTVNGNTNTNVSNTDTTGFFQVSRINSTQIIAGRNSYTTYTNSSSGLTNLKLYFFARNNNGSVSGYEIVQSPFGYTAEGLTLAEMNNFYNRVNTLMTYFGINV